MGRLPSLMTASWHPHDIGYPAAGHPLLAQRAFDLLHAARVIDHGVTRSVLVTDGFVFGRPGAEESAVN